jgi:hypothetical protein
MGFHPTHLDSHMGTLFATPAFLERYVQLGIEKQIPVMMPAGHATYIQADRRNASLHNSKKRADIALPEGPALVQVRALGEKLWRAGLPVLDDLHNTSYDWKIPPDAVADQ